MEGKLVRQRIFGKEDDCFEKAWQLYVDAFPDDERRMLPAQLELLEQPLYHFEAILKDDAFAGIFFWWHFNGLRFVEHFATSPQVRGGGVGRKLLENFIEESCEPIILEVEKPETEIARRRIGFYQRIGFRLNDYYYVQPPYRSGGNPLELSLMSFPQLLDEQTHSFFMKDCHPLIYGIEV